MERQSICALCRAPSSSKESVNIRADHGTGVIEVKEWVMTDLFQFALAHDAAAPTLVGFVSSEWEMGL